MPSYDIFFFSIVFFLIGVLAASFGFSFLFIAIVSILLAAIFLLRGILNISGLTRISKILEADKRGFSENLRDCLEECPAGAESLVPDEVGISAPREKKILPLEQNYSGSERQSCKSQPLFFAVILAFFILLGAGYYKYDDLKFKDIKIDFNKEINFSGLVIDDPQYSSNTQTLTVKLNESYKGKIQVKLMLYPQFHYGDKIAFKGKIEKPSALPAGQAGGSYADYLAKERIIGLANFPKAELEKSGLGSPIKSALFDFKRSIIDSYQKVLSPGQAALLAGLTFGERGNLDKEFRNAMSLSGTTHLTALSGQNITIIVVAIAAVFGFIFPQSMTFILTILVILGFAAMTGFDSSVVRAAIMGFVVLLANLAGRIYEPRNSIILAAFLIALFNPKSLVFDVGFQLSFLAVLGIIYLRPALKKILKFGDKPGFFAWRENFLMTLSAQLATAPVLIIAFGNFSLLALISNILILTAVPLTMALGFSIGFLYFLSHYPALILGWLTSLFLNYEIFIINFFAKSAISINPNLNFFSILFYYLILIGIIVWSRETQE